MYDDCNAVINGMNTMFASYYGKNEFMGVLALIPILFDDLSLTVTNMISD